MKETIIEVIQIMPATGWYFDGYWEVGYPNEWLPVVCFALVRVRAEISGSLHSSGTATRIIPLSPDNAFDFTDLIGKDVPANLEVKYRPSSDAFSRALEDDGIV